MVSLPATIAVSVSDPDALEDVRRLAAAATVGLVPLEAGSWHDADGVLVDAIGARAAAARPRREHVVVVTTDEPSTAMWQAAVAVGADRVVWLPHDERSLREWLCTLGPVGATGRVVCTVPGRGGVGASTLAAVIACAGARSDSTAVLVDGDPGAGGLDLLLGLEELAGARWPDIAVGAQALPWDDLPRLGGLFLVSGAGAAPSAVSDGELADVAEIARRSHELVVVDLPPGPESLRRLCELSPTAVLVLAAEVRTVAAVATAVRELRDVMDLRVVLRPGRGGLRPAEVAAALGVGVQPWRWQRGLDAEIEAGRLPTVRGPVVDIARRVLAGPAAS